MIQTVAGASSPIEFIDKMTSFAVPCVAFALAALAIIVLQILYMRSDRLLFVFIDLGLGFAGMISSLVTMNYYSTFEEIFEVNKAYMTATQLAMCPNITMYVLVSLVVAALFLGSIFVTLILLLIRKFLNNR